MRTACTLATALVLTAATGLGQSVKPTRGREYVSTANRQIRWPGSGEVTMHLCDPGYAMAGVIFGQNLFLCRWVGTARRVLFADATGPGQQRFDMLSCPQNYYMVGINVVNNRAYCAEQDRNNAERNAGATPGTPYKSGQYTFRACPQTTGRVGVVLGYRADRSRIACGEFGAS